ncbi:putative thiolester hydrolase [Lupinus albus]|uniref:Putative thiolester hydrolase n=1 Tax=Lupinus albus TaxID=3870 RepID=A0A6A4QHE7_LUPAL|nr:putative thiolester hydrolase [Lupinus albus]
MQPLRKPNLSLFHTLFRSRFRITPHSPLNIHIHNHFTTSPPHDSNSVTNTTTSTSTSTKTSSIDAGSSNRKPISQWPGMFHSPATHALWEARSSIFENPVNGNAVSSSQIQPVPKAPSRSKTSIFYNFSFDHILREQYRNPWNHIRMGKLVEDFDALAGTIAFKHCSNEDGTAMPLLLVTASVDRMVLKKPIHIDADLTIVGAVTWVGRSSMEIQLELTQPAQGNLNISDTPALVANFTFVARDSATEKAVPINQISPETEEERLLWEDAEKRNKLRKKMKLEQKHTENEDNARLSSLLAEGRIFIDMPALADRDSILLKDTCLQNSFICQPQQRNIHGRIFGGFLMRRAFELAFSTAYAFAGVAPHFLEVDHVDFVKPVDVGNFLRLKSCVLYTELDNPDKPLVNVEVVAHVTKPELRSSEVSNRFYFTFGIDPEAIKNGLRIRSVVPDTEEEARKVLERMDADNSKFG